MPRKTLGHRYTGELATPLPPIRPPRGLLDAHDGNVERKRLINQKLGLLLADIGIDPDQHTTEELLIRLCWKLILRHVPGFSEASAKRTGGRTPRVKVDTEQQFARKLLLMSYRHKAGDRKVSKEAFCRWMLASRRKSAQAMVPVNPVLNRFTNARAMARELTLAEKEEEALAASSALVQALVKEAYVGGLSFLGARAPTGQRGLLAELLAKSPARTKEK